MKILQDNEVINTFIISAVKPDYIFKCLQSLYSHTKMRYHRVICVLPPFKERSTTPYDIEPYVDVMIRTKRNYGWSASINLGLSMVRSKYFTVIHDDLEFIKENWWYDAVHEFEQYPDAMLVQPQEVDSKFKKKEDGEITNIYCMIFKREFVEKIGLFDERWYPVGPEDIDLLFRIKNAGYRTVLTNRTQVFHHGSGTVRNYAGYIWDKEKQYIEVEEKYGVPTRSHYDEVPKQIMEDVLKQI